MSHPAALTIDAHLFDVGMSHKSIEGCVQYILNETLSMWNNGADIVVFPEYAWMNLAQYRNHFDLNEFADFFWQSVFPEIQNTLTLFKDKMVVLGTVPYLENNTLLNRAIIYANGEFSFQDKLCVTPWEDQFETGRALNIIQFKQSKIAVLICLDSEIPSLSEMLKKEQVDIVLIPSATEDILGVERITRCASARAVELCCAVVVCGLTGAQPDNDFIDYNMGRAGLYLPSLLEFKTQQRIQETAVLKNGNHTERYQIAVSDLRKARISKEQTNPAIVFAKEITISR